MESFSFIPKFSMLHGAEALALGLVLWGYNGHSHDGRNMRLDICGEFVQLDKEIVANLVQHNGFLKTYKWTSWLQCSWADVTQTFQQYRKWNNDFYCCLVFLFVWLLEFGNGAVIIFMSWLQIVPILKILK